MSTLYDRIGGSYCATRRQDPRIAALIKDALGDVRSVVNVGAGTGAYEPTDREVLAVELSETMIAQRPRRSAPVIRASAEKLPLRDNSFDAALAVNTSSTGVICGPVYASFAGSHASGSSSSYGTRRAVLHSGSPRTTSPRSTHREAPPQSSRRSKTSFGRLRRSRSGCLATASTVCSARTGGAPRCIWTARPAETSRTSRSRRRATSRKVLRVCRPTSSRARGIAPTGICGRCQS